MKKSLFLLASTAIMSVAPVSAAFAAQQTLALSPSSQQVVVEQGTTFQGIMRVINQGETDYSFRVYSNPYSVSGENYHQNFNPLPGKPNPADWFKLPTTVYHIVPSQTIEIPYSITVPKGTLSGGYYGVIFAETIGSKSVNGITIKDRLGEIFYITVPGGLVVNGRTDSLKYSWLQNPPLTATARIENTGNVHFLTSVKATVEDMFGNSKLDYSTQKEILPQTVREIDVVWPKTPFFGVYKLNMSVSYLNHTKSVSTWILVMATWFRVVLISVVVAIIIFMLSRSRHKKRKHRYVSKNAKNPLS